MLKIDIDNFYEIQRFELQKVLHSMPCPFFIRLSSSRTGLHLAVPHCTEWDYRRIAYDDPMRINLDLMRSFKKLPVSNLLWDIKNGKAAGPWRVIKNSRQIENFLDSITTQPLYSRNAHWRVATIGRGIENVSI